MDINKILEGSLDEIADNIFNETKNTTDKAKAIQKQRIGENVQYVIDALKKIEADLRGDLRDEYRDVANKLSERIISIKNGQDGRNGADGRAGKDGRAGRDGLAGAKGADGLPGRDGFDGSDGVSVTDASIDFDGSLIISLSNGRVINVGEVVSQDLADKIQVISTMSTNGAGTGVFDAGTALLPSITTTGDLNTGVYFPAADTVGITAGGTERMRIIASPNTLFTGAASFFRSGSSPYNGVVIGDNTGYNFVFGYVSNSTGLFVPLVTITDNSGLAITGTLSATGVATFAAGTVALPSITISGDTNTGVYFPAADTVGITTGGAQRGEFSSTGLAVTGALSATGAISATGVSSFAAITASFGSDGISVGTSTGVSARGNVIYRGTDASSAARVGYVGINVYGTDGSFEIKHGSAGAGITISSSGNVGIGTTANASAILDAQSTTKGVRMPNMTTTQKNAIASPAAGLMVYDTTLAKLCVYTTAWETITSV